MDRAAIATEAAAGVLVLATVGWLLLAAEASGGDAMPPIGVILLCTSAYLLARLVTPLDDRVVPAVMVVGAALFAGLRFDILFSGPLRAPLGYSNAAGSLFMLSAAAALLLFVRSEHRVSRAVALIAAGAFAAVPWLNATTTAGALVLLLPLALLVRDRRGARLVLAASATAAVGSLVVVVYLGATYVPGRVPDWVHASLSERRLMLWNDAFTLLLQHPLAGVGPGRFPLVSPTALMDSDSIWPHNEILHFAAEAGIPGAVLLGSLVATLFARLWWARGVRGAAVAAAALGAAVVHSNIDFVLHFPAVGMAAAALVGTGAERARRRRVSVRARRTSPHAEPTPLFR